MSTKQGMAQHNGSDLQLCPALVPILHVGLKDVPGAVACLQDNTLTYVTGKCVATHSSEPSKVCVSEPCRDVRSITAMAASQDRKWIAVAEATAGTRAPQVSILDVQHGLERTGILLRGPSADHYNNVAFSADGMLLVACSQLSDDLTTIFHVWEWQTSSEPSSSGTVSGKAVKATINPKFPANVVVQSQNDLAYLRLGSSGYRLHPLNGLKKQVNDKVEFVDHAWLADGELVVALSNRRLLIMEGVEVQAVVALQRTPTCLAAMADGCLLVGTTNGCIELYRPEVPDSGGSSSKHLVLQAVMMMPDAGLGGGVMVSSDRSITQMSLEPGSERVVCYIKFGPVFMLNTRLAKTSSFRNNMATAEAMWEQLLPGMHAGSIVSASMAVRKELVVTASDDLTVRVWGIRPLRLVATHLCHHLPLAVAVDPGASELVVAYVDCVRLYSVVEGMLLEVGGLYLPSQSSSQSGEASHKDSVPARELSKVSIVCYSPTGHMLALVGGTSGREVLVYSALHRSLLARLTGHYSPVQDISWSEDGLYLCTVSDGAVYTWHMEGFRRLQENTTKGHNNNCVACTPDFGHLIVGESLQGLRMLATSRAAKHSQVSEGSDDGSVAASEQSTPQAGSALKSGTRPPNSTLKPGAGGNPTRRSDVSHQGKQGSNQGASAGPDGEGTTTGSNVRFIGDGNPTNNLGKQQAIKKPGGDTELDVVVPPQPVALPIRGGVAVCITPEYQAVVCAGGMGCLRVTMLPIRTQHHYQEYTVHSADITVLRAHFKGRLVLSGDAGGCWVLHQLLPPHQYKDLPTAVNKPPVAHASSTPKGSGSPRPSSRHLIGLDASLVTSPGSGEAAKPEDDLGAIVGRGSVMGPLPPYARLAHLARSLAGVKVMDGQDGSYDVLTVRAVDMHILQDSLREAREQLAKSATAADYKAYEREQQIRRDVDAQIAHHKHRMEEAETKVKEAQAFAAAEAKAAREHMESAEAQHRADMEAERDKLESRLAAEIARTNAAENEVLRIKAKFGKKLYDVQKDHKQETGTAQDKIVGLINEATEIHQDAQASINKAQEQMDTEMRLGHEIAEEEVGRIQEFSQNQVEERDERYIRLLAKHTLETGLASKTATENELVKTANSQLTTENTRLTEQVRGLSDELNAMHQAWADRDVKQRMQDAELKEVSRQASQGQMYTGLATNRIQVLSEEMEALRRAKKGAETLSQNLEAAQVRQAEKHIKFQGEHDKLKSRLLYLQGELARTKSHAKQRDEYFDNFANQLFRVVHNVNPDEWAQIFGRLHQDFVAGKDKLDWGSYRSPASQSSPADKAAVLARKKGAEERTVEELKTQLREMHAQVMHTERMMNLTRDTCDKERTGFKGLIARLQADNIKVMAQLNEAKRDLKAAVEEADMLRSEAHTMRILSKSSSVAGGGVGQKHPFSSTKSTSKTAAAPHNLSQQSSFHSPFAARVSASSAASAPLGSPGDEAEDAMRRASMGAGAWAYPRSLPNGEGVRAGGEAGAAGAAAPDGSHPPTAHTHLPGAVHQSRGQSAGRAADAVKSKHDAGSRPGTSPQLSHRGPLIARLGSTAHSTGAPLAPQTPPLEGISANDAAAAGLARKLSEGRGSLEADRPATSPLSSGLATPALLSRPSTSTVTGDMPQGGWWLEQNALFDPSSSLGVMRHLDVGSGPPHKRHPPPASGALNPSGRKNSRGGSRHSWSRGSAHGPSPPLAPSTPAGPSGARSLGSGLDVFAPLLQGHSTDALMGSHGLHPSSMQQQQQLQLQLFGGVQPKNAPSWRPGVPTAEIYSASTPTGHASLHNPLTMGSLTGLRTLLGIRQGQQQTQVHGATAPGMEGASHASSPQARPFSSPPPTFTSSARGTSAAVSSSMPGPGNVFVATPGAMHALGQGPHQHPPDHQQQQPPDHQQQFQQQRTDHPHLQQQKHPDQPQQQQQEQPGHHQQQHQRDHAQQQQQQQQQGHQQQEPQHHTHQRDEEAADGHMPLRSSAAAGDAQQLGQQQQHQHRQQQPQQPQEQRQVDAEQCDVDSAPSPSTATSTTTSLQKPLSSPEVDTAPHTNSEHQHPASQTAEPAAASPPAAVAAGAPPFASETVSAPTTRAAGAAAAAAGQPPEPDPGANFGPWSLESPAPPAVPALPSRSATSAQVPEPINQPTPRRSSTNSAVGGANVVRAPPPPSTPRQRQQQRTPRTHPEPHEIPGNQGPESALSRPEPFGSDKPGTHDSSAITPPPTPPCPSNLACLAPHPTPANASHSLPTSHPTHLVDPATYAPPAAQATAHAAPQATAHGTSHTAAHTAPAATHPAALSRPHTSGPAMRPAHSRPQTSGPAFQGSAGTSAPHQEGRSYDAHCWEGGTVEQQLEEGRQWEGGPNEDASYAGAASATSPAARPHTSHPPSTFTLRMPGAGGPAGSVHPHSNATVPPRLSTMGGGFRTFVPRQATHKATPRGLHTSHNR